MYLETRKCKNKYYDNFTVITMPLKDGLFVLLTRSRLYILGRIYL